MNIVKKKHEYYVTKNQIPIYFAFIPQYYISRIFTLLFGRNIININRFPKLKKWLNNDQALNDPVFNFKKHSDPKHLQNEAINKKSLVQKPLYDLIKANYKKDSTLKILDIGCGDGLNMYALAATLTEYKFMFYGFEPAKVRIDNAYNLFNTFKLNSVINFKFDVGTFNQQADIVKKKQFDIIICDQIITLMDLYDFKLMCETLKLTDYKYLMISARMNYYYGIVGGTMPVYENILKNNYDFDYIDKYFCYRKPNLLKIIFKIPFSAIKPLYYWQYKYLILKKNN